MPAASRPTASRRQRPGPIGTFSTCMGAPFTSARLRSTATSPGGSPTPRGPACCASTIGWGPRIRFRLRAMTRGRPIAGPWRGGATPAQVAFVGDSAGGGLTFAALMRLRDQGTPLPAAAVAISPWTDLALTGASLRANAAAEAMLAVEILPPVVAQYLADADPYHPHASPLYGNAAGLPPTLILTGSDDVLLDDAMRMADALR